MRHLNGIYTQRHNHHMRTDGPLFRGRYKALLVERENYLIRVSRYIHRNPLEAGLGEHLIDYRWSSYPVYAGREPSPPWLYQNQIRAIFPSAQQYCDYVEHSTDAELDRFYAQSRVPPVLGSEVFVDDCRKRLPTNRDYEIAEAKALADRPNMDRIIGIVAQHFNVHRSDLLQPPDAHARMARNIAMMLCRRPGGHRLRNIARTFGLDSYTTVASSVNRLLRRVDQDENVARSITILLGKLSDPGNA